MDSRPILAPVPLPQAGPGIDLLGRAEEVDIVMRVLRGAGDGGRTLVLDGAPGVGKSSILMEAVASARAEAMTVLSAYGVETESPLPFSGVLELVSPVLRNAERINTRHRRALLTAIGLEDGEPPESFLVALAVLNLITESADQAPVLIAVDDVQWLDDQTIAVLGFIGRRIARDPVVLLATCRSGSGGPFGQGQFDMLPIDPLDVRSSELLLARSGRDLSMADRATILREAAGNPLALVELPRAWSRPGDRPAGVIPLTARLENAFASRFSELPPRTRDAMLIAAISDEGTLGEIMAAVEQLGGRPARIGVLDPAVEARLLAVDGDRLAFRHPLVRSAILQNESLERRQQANEALAAVLVDQPYRRAWHLAQATVGTDEGIADELEASHLEPLRRGSPVSAVWALERAAQLTADSSKRGRRLLLAAELAFSAGRADIVHRLIDAASQTQLAELDRARMEWLSEIFDDGVPGDAARIAQLCRVATRAAGSGDSRLAINLLLGAALRCWWAEPGDDARQLVVSAVERLGLAWDDPHRVAILATADPLGSGTEVGRALAHSAAEVITDPDALRLLGQAAHAIGDAPRSIDFLSRVESRLRRDGRLGHLSQVITMQILDNITVGDWNTASAEVEEARLLAKETGQTVWDAGSTSLAAINAAVHGQTAIAEQLASDVELSVQGRSLNDLLACTQLARGLAAASTGDYSHAYDALRRLFDRDDITFHPTERFHAIAALAEAGARCGRIDDARRVVGRLHGEAQTTDAANLHAALRFADAVLAPDDDAERLFRSAVESDRTRWPLLRARSELGFGMWLRRRRRGVEAREHLRAAVRIFEHIGATYLAESAASELRATGEALPEGTAPASALSAQELQIARLAAEGLSNRQIGEQLYLSPRTVGSHLYRIFPKLGVSSRTQLGSRMSRVDP